MYFKHFMRWFLLIGMIVLGSAPLKADEIQIGSGTQTDYNLPTHSNYNYSLTQQIYTAAEIESAGGAAGIISSIAFYNGGNEKTRSLDIYLANTSKDSFSGPTDWITVSASDKVFSGSVTFTAGQWTTIPFSSSFEYDGSNLAVIVDDNTNSYSSGLGCRYYITSETQSIYYRNDYTNPIPTDPTISGTPTTYKNQIVLDIEMATVTCAKPKSFQAESVTAHTANLTWQAGAEGQSSWEVYVTTTDTNDPGENPAPTYQVAECVKALEGLTAQTTYYAFVRSLCGGTDGNSKWAKKAFTTTREALTVDATHPYSQDFEAGNDWGFTNGTLTNQWCWGNATHNGGAKAMYVSKDGGTTYEYAHSNTTVFASKLFNFSQGTYTFVFDWMAYGESTYDFLRVALVPGDMEFSAGTSLPSGVTATALPSTWISLDGGKLNLKDSWQTQTAEAAVSGTYTMVFLWRNDGSGGTQPPAAIDNISISYMTCPRPSNLAASNITGRSATLAWTENGTATEWVLQYATNSTFTESLSEITASGTPERELVGLSPETKYFVRVKSVLGNEESSWSDVKDFTTTATCEKPTNWKYTAYSATAYSGSVEWEGNADNYHIAFRPTTDFDPADETAEDVTRIALGSVNTYTLENLKPETKYYVYIQADCGAEDGTSSWSNRVTFTTEATCLAPSGLAATATSSTITLSWTAGAEDQNAWDIRYKKTSDSEYTLIHLANHPTTSYTITGLNPVTTYGVNVRAWCAEDDQSKWGAGVNQNYDKEVTTDCAALSLPYSYGFEENLQTTSPYSTSYPMPKCWNAIRFASGYGSPTYYPYVFTATSSQPYAHGGDGANSYTGHSLRFYQTSSSTNECAVLPEISDEYLMQRLQIRFWAAVQSSRGTLKIGVMDSPTDASTFTSIQEVTVSNTYSSGFQEYSIPLSDYTGNGRYIAFMCGTGSTYAYFLIDDITVEVVPFCRIPDNLEASEVAEEQATLTWTPQGIESTWHVQYKKASDSDWGELITVEEPTYTLTGLKRGIQYEARVQASCTSDESSDWSNAISFCTECGSWPIDNENTLFEDFNGETFPPACWQKVNFGEMGASNGWLRTVNNALDNQGAVSSDFKHETWLFLPLMHIGGNASLSFDHLFGSGNDYVTSSIMACTNPDINVEDIKEDGFIEANFSQIWTADQNNLPSTKRKEVVSLSDFSGEDVYIAFRYEGTYNYSGKIWYIDNVQVYMTSHVFTKEIAGYGQGKGNYYLIASPLADDTDPELVGNMLANSYDLYAFDQSEALEWQNYKANHFNLENGMGYLYANSDTVTLTFIGTPVQGNTIDIPLAKKDVAGDFPGWNLVGNPFADTAYIEDGRPFYTMNADGSEIIAAADVNQSSIAPMEGVFVIAETDGETMQFTTAPLSSQKRGEGIVLNVSKASQASRRGNVVVDRAIVRISEGNQGRQLPKFQIRNNSTKVYIPQDGTDYAVVNVGREAMHCASTEIPVNFKASENGVYTLGVESQDVQFDYLHLIDNKTGEDIDLLRQPSYTFNANTADYSSRFKLVFMTQCHDNSQHFAYFSNGKLVVLNEGEACLQLIDMTGRVIYTQTVNGSSNDIDFHVSPGIYNIRLIKGDVAKSQKILVN